MIKSKSWQQFFERLYSSQKPFFVRSGYGSLSSLISRKIEVKYIVQKFYRNGRVLDAGCGIGNFADLFPQKYVGVDYSREAITELKNKRSEALLVVADISALPFKHETFSFINSIEVIQYLDDFDLASSEFYRVMKTGFCVIIFPSKNSLFWRLRQKIKGKSPLKFLSISDVKNITKKHGFKIAYISGIFFAPPKFNFVINRMLRFFPSAFRNLMLDTLSKSLVVVLQKV